MDAHDLFFSPEPHQRNKATRKIWDIKKTKFALGRDVTSNILFVHAILGCDTTSRIYCIGNGVALKKAKTEVQFCKLASVFDRADAARDEIIRAGEKAVLSLFNSASLN